DDEVAVEKFEVPKANKAEGSEEQNFDDYSKVGANIKFAAGKHVLRITATADWFDIDYFNFVKGANAEDDNPYGEDIPPTEGIANKVMFTAASQDLVVFNMLGKKLGTVRLNGNSAAEALRMSGYSAGMYMVRGKGVNQVVNTAK
ncbi:MAG: hypothetical protein HUK19_03895, partial [Fibrobacter sp.]|nr:hypothetical protein [Fibrobacter sp.]